MCAVGSRAGADLSLASDPGATESLAAQAAGVSRVVACRIVGVEPAGLERLSAALETATGRPLPGRLCFADLLALAVVDRASRRLRSKAISFAIGFGQVFALLAGRSDLERLDGHVFLIGRDFARLVEIGGARVRCAANGFVVVPLRPILTDLRDQVFP